MRLPPRLPRALIATLLVLAAGVAGAAPCPTTAGLTIVADNQSADDDVTITVTGHIADATSSCEGGDTTYAATFTCSGAGQVRCGRITGLQPGAWIHEISLQVAGSQPQVQTQRVVVLADAPSTLVSNVVPWTIYPRAFQVSQIDGTHLLAQLTAAQSWTGSHAGQYALVTFDREIFPGAGQPKTINVKFSPNPNTCVPQQVCSDGRGTTYCFSGSRVVVDALDAEARRGGVILRTGTCERSLMRILGSDNVFRGLELRGSEKVDSPIPVDTIAITGAGALRNRVEQCIVRGPTRGDSISLEASSGAPGGPDVDNVVVDTEITGAEDKGIKITSGAHGTILESCVHDNRNGGIQSTLGGHVTVVRNVVQRNAPGAAQNGLSVGVPENVILRSSMVTDGNIVRFAGARGISVVNTGDGFFNHDVVTDNQSVGTRIETTQVGVRPEATFRGLTVACNAQPVTGVCFGEPSKACVRHADCTLQQCVGFVNGSDGFGAVVGIVVKAQPDVGDCPDMASCLAPEVDFGPTAGDPGRNAFTLNPSLGSQTPGINFNNLLPQPNVILARGNQWEHCGDGTMCDSAAVEANDLRPVAVPPVVTIGTPTGPRGGPAPEVARVSLSRPRKGDLVRVYNGVLDDDGGAFNAVAGTACVTPSMVDGLPGGIPADICSADSPNVVTQNRTSQRGNHVTLAIGGQTFDADIHAVTPTMLAFRMPVDCWAAGTITVARGSDVSMPAPFCDAGGCADRSAGAMCDDASVCTVGDLCDASGACVPGPALDCSGQCRTGACDPQDGCGLQPDTATCDDGDACTVEDHCAGDSTSCEPGTPRVCVGACLTGACDSSSGCTPQPNGTGCDDGNACTVNDHCDGVDGACSGGTPLSCDDGNPCTTDGCDPASGCTHVDLDDGATCAPSDACHGAATCHAGRCDGGTPLACGDADFCTVDSCSLTLGCVNEPAVGTASVACRLEESRFILSSAPGGGGPMTTSLLKQLAKVDTALSRLSSASTDKTVKRATKKARATLRELVGRIHRGRKKLGVTLERQLKRSADAAIVALDGLRP